MQGNNGCPNRPLVMVRSWGDEPVRLYLHRLDNNRSYVGFENAVAPIGLPNEQVFGFNEDRFSELSTAFAQGDKSKVRELWSAFHVDDYACNRYKINLESLHDQEHIGGPRSASKCSGE